MGLSHVTILLALVAGVTSQPTPPPHGQDSSVCSPNTVGATNLPNLPASFSMRVEANILNKNQTTTLHEYYNSDANMAAVRQIEDGVEAYFFYYYGTNQILEVAPDSNGDYLCYGQDLSQSENQNMFGIQKINSTSDRIYSVYGALHFGGSIKQNYLGQESIRGIPCNKWQSCQYWADMDATSNVTWYFSDETQWSSISGYSAPVRCVVNGRRWANASYSYTYQHVYEFFDFQAALPAQDDHFDVPTNTYCYGEVNRKPLPNMPPAYSFNAELVDTNAKTIEFIREFYDNKTQLMRYDYRAPAISMDPFGTRYAVQIHDYNTGVAYLIDVLRANCTAYLIPDFSFDDENVGSGHVRLRNPKEFLDLDHKYDYQGVRTVRNIECDAWSVVRFDYPNLASNNNPASVWTWYFATENWMRNMGFRDNFVLPIMLEIFSDAGGTNMHKMMSFYEYDAEEPDLFKFDIATCYGPTQSKNIAFFVPGRYIDIVAGDVKLFKYFVMMSIQAYTSVSPLRISRLDLQEAGDNVLVTFDLLDKAPLSGDIPNPPREVTLNDAYTLLVNGINNGKLQILMQKNDVSDLRILTAKPAPAQFQFHSSSRARRSAANPSTSSSGYSGGAMGGMAVGMLVLGALLGFGIMFVVYKVRGGSFSRTGGGIGMKRFENDREQVAGPDGES